MQLVLSLFPGIGLLDMAFEREGFIVVRGPDVLWGGDIRRLHPPAGKFDGVIGGPPCQSFSSLAHLVRANGHEPKFGNLIPEFERCVLEAQPDWFVMENVRAAPEPSVEGYGLHSFLINNCWLAGPDGLGQEQERLRRFCFGRRGKAAEDLRRWIEWATLLLPEAAPTATQGYFDNSPEAKGRKAAVFGDGCPTRQEVRHPTLTGGNDKPPSARSRRQCVVSDPSAVPIKIGGSGKVKSTYPTRQQTVTALGPDHLDNLSKSTEAVRNGTRSQAVTSSDGRGKVQQRRYRLADACRLQGLPEDFLADAPFTAEGKLKAVANGVPLPMGLVIARAVKEATQ